MRKYHLYVAIVYIWLLLLASSIPGFYQVIDRASTNPLALVLTVFSVGAVSYFWLNGIKDFLYPVTYYLLRLGKKKEPTQAIGKKNVHLVYCSCNDFDGHSLLSSMKQSVPVKVIILDDSYHDDEKAKVDAFAAEHNVQVVRRADRVGYKAGNLNNYLRSQKDWEYFVILDSDEIIPYDFVEKCLPYFNNQEIGIVQANHKSTRNLTPFQKLFSKGVDSHWPVYQSVKNEFGFLSLLGHGAMVSRECYGAAGGFPEVVAEDLCFSIRARSAGYYVAFAKDVICEETYPVDWMAFRKRHSKWTQGNMEFIKRFSKEIIQSPMKWYEKLDIVLFTYSLPLTFAFFSFLIINVLILPIMGYEMILPKWMLVPTILFFIAPMLNDWVWHRSRSIVWHLKYTIGVFFLYGSMFYTSIYSSLKSLFGKAVFIVTPKIGEKVSVKLALIAVREEMVFSATLLAIAYTGTQSLAPVALLVVAAASSLYMSLFNTIHNEN